MQAIEMVEKTSAELEAEIVRLTTEADKHKNAAAELSALCYQAAGSGDKVGWKKFGDQAAYELAQEQSLRARIQAARDELPAARKRKTDADEQERQVKRSRLAEELIANACAVDECLSKLRSLLGRRREVAERMEREVTETKAAAELRSAEPVTKAAGYWLVRDLPHSDWDPLLHLGLAGGPGRATQHEPLGQYTRNRLRDWLKPDGTEAANVEHR